MTTLTDSRPGCDAGRTRDLYRAVWRWHFYAGLLVIPFLILLAVTGGLFLFHNEIDNAVYHDDFFVAPHGGSALAPSALTASAQQTQAGRVLKYTPPPAADRSAAVLIKTPAGERVNAYVDPYDGRVLGTLPELGTVMWTIRRLHSLAYFGPIASGAIEIAAGWSILLVLTGIYLWWPRGRKGGVVTVRSRPAQRVFWRDLHAVLGAFVGIFILFLAVTGMPWSQVWGGKVNQWANGNNFGYPNGVRVNIPMSNVALAGTAKTSWSMQEIRVPLSTPPAAADMPDMPGMPGMKASAGADPGAASGAHAGHDAAGGDARMPAYNGAGAIGLDAAVAIFNRMGLAPGYAIALPTSATGVYSAAAYTGNLDDQRVTHLDQYSGRPLIDAHYSDYGPFGRALEWGINVHMGQEFGLANQLVLLAACVAIVLLCVSAAVMWWKRRPQGALGVPPMPEQTRILVGVVAILAIGGIVFPLVGASLLVMLAIDALWMAGTRRRKYAVA